MPLQSAYGSYFVQLEPNTVAAVNVNSTSANTTHTLTSAATTNATVVKNSAGRVSLIALTNTNAADRFFKLYSKATAPTVGTDIPIMTIPVAANSFRIIDFSAFGLQIPVGIGYAVTGLIADSDATAISAGDFKVVITFT